MSIPPQWQTPTAQQALADALERAIRNPPCPSSGATSVTTIDPEALTRRRHGLPHGAEFARVVKLARAGDRLALAEVRTALQRSRDQHAPVTRGIAWEPPTKPGRAPQTRMIEVIARFVLDEIRAGASYADAMAVVGEIFTTIYGERLDGTRAAHPLTRKRLERAVRDLLKRRDPA